MTEFPFSYSLLGIVLLLQGEHIDLANISSAQFTPLLVLIGFLATTLSITDPFGRILRRIGRYFAPVNLTTEAKRDDVHLPGEGGDLPQSEAVRKRYLRETLARIRDEISLIEKRLGDSRLTKEAEYREKELSELKDEEEKLRRSEHAIISELHRGDLLKEQKRVVDTKWISQEIDKIVAMFYFVTIMLIFFWALSISSFSNQFTEAIKPLFGNQSANDTLLLLMALPVIAIIGVALAILFSVIGLLDKIGTISTYFLAIDEGIGKDDSYIHSVEESLSKKDWGLAKFWSGQLLRQIDERSQIPRNKGA